MLTDFDAECRIYQHLIRLSESKAHRVKSHELLISFRSFLSHNAAKLDYWKFECVEDEFE